MTSIEGNVFTGCSSLESIIVDENNAVYDSRENCNAIIEKDSNRLVSGCNKTVIPDSVKSIGGAFAGCSGLTSIVIPDEVTWIGDNIFEDCDSLTSIVWRGNVYTSYSEFKEAFDLYA